jgi:hypothetical protein
MTPADMQRFFRDAMYAFDVQATMFRSARARHRRSAARTVRDAHPPRRPRRAISIEAVKAHRVASQDLMLHLGRGAREAVLDHLAARRGRSRR